MVCFWNNRFSASIKMHFAAHYCLLFVSFLLLFFSFCPEDIKKISKFEKKNVLLVSTSACRAIHAILVCHRYSDVE